MMLPLTRRALPVNALVAVIVTAPSSCAVLQRLRLAGIRQVLQGVCGDGRR